MSGLPQSSGLFGKLANALKPKSTDCCSIGFDAVPEESAEQVAASETESRPGVAASSTCCQAPEGAQGERTTALSA